MANIRLGLLDDDRRNLVGVGATTSQTAKFRARDGKQGPHPTKVNGKFYWLHMTNPVAKIPCQVTRQGKVKDLTDWLKFYGEPHPDIWGGPTPSLYYLCILRTIFLRPGQDGGWGHHHS